jgi:hypothetical protein
MTYDDPHGELEAVLNRRHVSAARYQPLRWPEDVPPYPDTACPVCAEPAIYSTETDRYYHMYGRGNRDCWAQLLMQPLIKDGDPGLGKPDHD